MPNGHSGGFYLERKELEKLLVVLEYNAEVGDTSEKPVTTAGLAEILDHCNDDRLIVEEQDHGWYIIQFLDPKDWIVVTSKSPLFEGFRRYHEEWRKEREKNHPRP